MALQSHRLAADMVRHQLRFGVVETTRYAPNLIGGLFRDGAMQIGEQLKAR